MNDWRRTVWAAIVTVILLALIASAGYALANANPWIQLIGLLIIGGLLYSIVRGVFEEGDG